MINTEQQNYILGLVKNAVRCSAGKDQPPDPSMFPVSLEMHDQLLGKKFGAFVTLKKDNKLRGCIGSVIADKTLKEQLVVQSFNATNKDTRFQPVDPCELDCLTYEVSILTQPHAVKSVQDINVSKHGIILEKNNKRALFLPKVAKENQWTLEQTLTHLCVKARLKPDDWKQHTHFSVFEAFEF